MRILIVDDSTAKRRHIQDEIRSATGRQVTIVTATNVNEALKELTNGVFDLMVLDLHLPIRRNNAPVRNGGAELLRQIRQRAADRSAIRPRYIFALSAHDDVVEEQKSLFMEEAIVLIPYDESSTNWRGSLRNQVVQAAAALAECKCLTSLCVVTALHKTELQAVLELPANWEQFTIEGDATRYYRGRFERGKKSLVVMVAAATEMGMPAAAALSMKMIFLFRPRVLAMTGLAAGFRGNFGDILVAYDSWDYGSGKRVSSGTNDSEFLPRPNYLPIDLDLKNRLEIFSMEHGEVLSQIRADWAEAAPPGPPDVIAGPLASGASVLADRSVLSELKLLNDKLIGVEMEAYGVFAACRSATTPRPAALVCKSICDYGDNHKDDRYQRYAAYTSAKYLYEFALAKLDA